MNENLAWNPDALAAYEWLEPFLKVPDDASPPLAMSPPPDDAVGSYGADAIAWIEDTQRITLRWWQALAITRQLEHREDGSLCHRVVLESAPRRAGKSVRVRGVALWRMAHPGLFGEVQTVIHTGSDVAICREIQRGAWRWAEEIAGWKVSQANGKEAIESLTGDRWLVRAQRAVYGYDVCLGIVDEGWNVAPDTVSEGLEPATLERSSPQLHLTSTAHRRATSLMRSRLKVALAGEDEDLLLLWGAPVGSDPGNPEVWRAASPYWSEDRRRLITDKYAKAQAGQADPQADDPDPMAGFTAQYLNIWPLDEAPDPAISGQGWVDCQDPAPMEGKEVWCFDVAWSGRSATLYAAVPTEAGGARIEPVHRWEGEGCADAAVRELPRLLAEGKPRKLGYLPNGPAARVGARLKNIRVPGVMVEEIKGELSQVCMGLAEAVDARTMAHSGYALLNDQVEVAGKKHVGERWVFQAKEADLDALYAAAGAVHLVVAAPVPSSMGIILPRVR